MMSQFEISGYCVCSGIWAVLKYGEEAKEAAEAVAWEVEEIVTLLA
jgi:hypothetical protein